MPDRGEKVTMIVRFELDDGGETETSIPGPFPGSLTELDVAVGLLAVFPDLRRVRVWADGLSFLDEPTADVRRDDAGVLGPPSSDVLDVATAVLLVGDGVAPGGQEDAPEWLSPWRPQARPFIGRAGTGQ
ncbi:hypothetical protein I6A84_08840 [Frankia sp. CNm7]|uniref:Uncharacterized protein n=1 Tax=Frankia nepalensis TaxID=1836974 RepID=A0A937UK90_9ACTN|nr:hypothetical protein [Frankia nepalensis]MBL7494852.1 hypothetical protein [Frankia nepalensis]MBL7512206.1 hypothetical protein [Frankia nepalensis]MBL7518217.1 hypothetical protein [Frankia nepalensis]MBL7626579.1 hypothetical protein [Frankia nepalensis]